MVFGATPGGRKTSNQRAIAIVRTLSREPIAV
jgi:hypothetical protein